MSDSDSLFSYGHDHVKEDFEVDYYNTHHIYPDIGRLLQVYPLPTGPPQPQKVSFEKTMLPGDHKLCTTTTFSHWMEWRGEVPMWLDHVKSVVCLNERRTEIVDSPFERGPFEVIKVESELKTITPTADSTETKMLYLENENHSREHYNFSIYEGAPIFLPWRHQNLDGLEGYVRRCREKGFEPENDPDEHEFQQVLAFLEKLLCKDLIITPEFPRYH